MFLINNLLQKTTLKITYKVKDKTKIKIKINIVIKIIMDNEIFQVTLMQIIVNRIININSLLMLDHLLQQIIMRLIQMLNKEFMEKIVNVLNDKT